jgi:DNA invertase Pin-like site-specific DNA recombinase
MDDRIAALYVRESSKGQEGNWSNKRQITEGKAFAESERLPFLIYEDIKSGKDGSVRPKYEVMKTDIAAGKISVVFFWKYARLGRDAEENELFKKLLVRHKVRLYEAESHSYLDLTNSGTDLITTVQGKLTEIDNKERGKYVLDALKEQHDSGDRRYSGALFGYFPTAEIITIGSRTKVKRTWHVQEQEAEAIRLMYDLALQEKLGLCGIARELYKRHVFTRRGSQWSHNRIRLTLRHCQYAGLTTNSVGELIESRVYPPIIEREKWEMMQRKYPEYITRAKRGRPNERLSSGLLVCSACDCHYAHFVGVNRKVGKGGIIHNYVMNSYRHNLRGDCGSQKYYQQDVVDTIVLLAFYNGLFHKKELIDNMMKSVDVSETVLEQDRLKRIVEKNSRSIESLLAVLEHGVEMETLAPRLKFLQEDNKKIKREIAAIDAILEHKSKELKYAREMFSTDTLKEFERLDDKGKNAMVKRIIRRVVVNRAAFLIEYIDGTFYSEDYKKVQAAMRAGQKIKGETVVNARSRNADWVKKLKREMRKTA